MLLIRLDVIYTLWQTHMVTANPGEFTQINFCQAAEPCNPHPPVSEGFSVAEDVEAKVRGQGPGTHCNQIGGRP